VTDVALSLGGWFMAQKRLVARLRYRRRPAPQPRASPAGALADIKGRPSFGWLRKRCRRVLVAAVAGRAAANLTSLRPSRGVAFFVTSSAVRASADTASYAHQVATSGGTLTPSVGIAAGERVATPVPATGTA